MTVPVYFCGCLREPGHFVHSPAGGTAGRGSPEGCPWPYLDSRAITPPGPLRQGNAVLRHKDGWTVLSIHDFTIDDRPGSHSTFATGQDLDLDAMLAAVRDQWPSILDRVGELTIVQNGGRS